MEDRRHTLLVDESHLIMRNVNIPELAKLRLKDKTPVGGVYGILSSINRCLKNDPTINKVILLRDGHAKWRKDIYPGYKASRANNPSAPGYRSYIEPDQFGWSRKDTLTWTRNKIKEIAPYFGMRVMFDELSEADDLAYLVGKDLLAKGEKVTFLTSDKDWSQLVNIFKDYDVAIFDGMKNEIINKNNFNEKYGVDPEWFVFQKAMLGDGSDDIPGVIKGCGEKAILKLIEMAQEKGLNPDIKGFREGLYDLVDSLNEKDLGRFKGIKQLTTEESKSNLNRNVRLVDFRACPHKPTLFEQIAEDNEKEVKMSFMDASKVMRDLEFNKLSDIVAPGSPWYRLK